MIDRGPAGGTADRHGDRQTENLLGALSLTVTDRMLGSVTSAGGQSTSAAITLSVLRHFPDELTIDLLRQVLGLTSSGAVRLVDRLRSAGAVRRGRGPDRRITTVSLTASGRRAARRVTDARRSVLRDALTVLSDDERRQLGQLAGRVLAAMVRPSGATQWICRLCDLEACGRAEGRCPVASAAGLTPREDAPRPKVPSRAQPSQSRVDVE